MYPSSLPSSTTRKILTRALLASASLAALLLTGCETMATYRTHPEFKTRLTESPTIVAAPTDIEIRQIGAGGVAEEVDEYSEEANRLFATSLKRSGNKKIVSTFDLPAEQKDEFAEISTLAKTVMLQIFSYSYMGNLPGFKHKSDNFRYSVGDISSILDNSGSDQMLFIFGYDSYTTSGRKFVNGMMTVLIGYVALENTGGVFAMLVNRNGDVLWVDQHLDVSIDLRQAEHINKVVDIFLTDLEAARTNATPAASR